MSTIFSGWVRSLMWGTWVSVGVAMGLGAAAVWWCGWRWTDAVAASVLALVAMEMWWVAWVVLPGEAMESGRAEVKRRRRRWMMWLVGIAVVLGWASGCGPTMKVEPGKTDLQRQVQANQGTNDWMRERIYRVEVPEGSVRMGAGGGDASTVEGEGKK